ncbi:MAG TPA: hypothetical protein VJ965_07135 [Anaerolineales bacterium]|nr:hypothetical protein [Anaerolineales bacterium]
MDTQRFPNINRVSVVVATILLAFALIQLFPNPESTQTIAIGGFLLPFAFDITTFITIAVAAITASGTDWILRSHPALEGKSSIPHLFLPAITAWVTNILLNNMADTPLKWGVFLIGGVFLFVVILSEYIAIFPEDYRRLLAVALLTALSYGLFLALAASLESADQRLIIAIPAIALGSSIFSMRILQLQTGKDWPLAEAAACMLVTTQVGAGLHYLPIPPLSHGLFLFGTLYFVINFNTNMIENNPVRQALIESTVPLVIISGIALWLS